MSSDDDLGVDAGRNRFQQWLTRFVDDHVVAVMLGIPTLVLAALFVYPLVWVLYQSLWVSIAGVEARFDPFFNYRHAVVSGAFVKSMGRTLLYAFGSFSLSFTGGLFFALVINRIRPQWLRTSYLTALTSVLAIPVSIVGLLWGAILAEQEAALLNSVLLDLGVIRAPIAYLQIKSLVLPIVVVIDAWIRMPLAMVVFLAGRQAIPVRFYEAALVDGASTLQTFRHVTLPHLRPYMVTVVLLIWATAFQAFSVIWVMTGGGPVNRTQTVAVLLYEFSIIHLNFGWGAALATVLVVITAVLTTCYVTFVMER